ncbi:MAG: divergent PAP2 family protein [Patescibacteria group bacterium]|nr:divergent PAP2 family protein [Patescibacteria group bacterium]
MFIVPKILIIALVAGVLVQIIKVFVMSWQNKELFNIHYLSRYGGMPSTHSAFLASLTSAVFLEDGYASTSFAICLIFSIIIIRDAFGFRMLLENQGKTLLRMIENHRQEFKEVEKYRRFKTLGLRVGHTLPEIFVGAMIGILVTLSLFFII